MKPWSRGIALGAAAMVLGVALQPSASLQQTRDQQPSITVYKSPT